MKEGTTGVGGGEPGRPTATKGGCGMPCFGAGLWPRPVATVLRTGLGASLSTPRMSKADGQGRPFAILPPGARCAAIRWILADVASLAPQPKLGCRSGPQRQIKHFRRSKASRSPDNAVSAVNDDPLSPDETGKQPGLKTDIFYILRTCRLSVLRNDGNKFFFFHSVTHQPLLSGFRRARNKNSDADSG